jgi:class 3 adenylate cyclase
MVRAGVRTATILFTDIEASTDLRTAKGDEEAGRILDSHQDLMRRKLSANGGREIKDTGDGLMAAFASARDAVECAVDIQRALAERTGTPRVRIGINAGEVAERGADLSGTAVNAAVRIMAKARGGQILVSDVVRRLAGGVPGVEFEDRRYFKLKGFPERWRLFEAIWQDAAPAAALRIRLLGPLEVEGAQTPALPSRKARTVLKVLALERAPVSADALAFRLWRDELPSRPAEQVAVLVSRLRRALPPDTIVRSDAGYALSRVRTDVADLEELAAEASARLRRGSHGAAAEAARAALALVRGPLLCDEPDSDWADAERTRTERLVSTVRRTGARAALDAGDFPVAEDLASQALDSDPLDEEALRIGMSAAAACGRPASALAAYESMRERLRDELGVDPAPPTRALWESILREDAVPARGTERAPDVAVPAGRDAEIAELDRALESAARGLRLLCVEGEAGIGKSTVAEAWARMAAASGTRVLRARCDELGRDLPLQVVLDALHGWMKTAGDASALGAEHAVLGPLLGLGDAGRAPASSAWDPEAGKAVIFAALLAVLTRVALPGPAALVLEDVHLAGPSTIEWLNFVRRRGESARLLVVVTRRPEEGAAIPDCPTIKLGPLPAEAVAAVVGAERAEELWRRSGGHPLFLVELASAAQADDLPSSITESVAARCERAGRAAPTLRAAAVLGPEIDLDLLAGVLGRPAVELLEHLEEGLRRLFLEERGTTFAFRHELVREALAQGMSHARRALLHREAGRFLSSRPEHDPSAVAYHARLGGDAELASSALAEAARAAAGRFDYAEAARLLDEAAALHDSADVRLQRGKLRLWEARYEEAGEDASAALRLGAGAPALELAGFAAYYARDFERARRLAEDGVRLAADQPDVLASCLGLAGRVRLSRGDLGEASVRLTRAIGLSSGMPGAFASIHLAQLQTARGAHDEAIELAQSATRAPADPEENPTVRIYADTALAHAFTSTGRPHEALAVIDRLRDRVDRAGIARFGPRVWNYRASALRCIGDLAGSDEHNQRALEEVAGDPLKAEPHVYALLDLADSRLIAGEVELGLAFLRDAEPVQRIDHANQWRDRLKSMLLQGRAALMAGDATDALTLALETAEESAALDVPRFETAAHALEAQCRLVLGEGIDAAKLDEVLRRLGRAAIYDAWPAAAALSVAAGVDGWWTLAESYVSSIAAGAGERAEEFGRYASRRLDAIRSGQR